MNKTKKLLSVLLAVIMALSCMSVMASAAKTNYQTVDNLKALDAYSPYGQVTRLSTEERMSITLDFLDTVLAGANIAPMNLDITIAKISVNIQSVNGLCSTVDSVNTALNSGFSGFLVGIVGGLLGIIADVNFDTWQSGMTRENTSQLTIIRELLELLDANKGILQNVVSSGEINLGSIIGGLVDLSAVTDLIGDIPGMIKGLVWGLFERWDDTLVEIKDYDSSSTGNGKIESTLNTFVKNLFNNDMSQTTLKYDADGNMTSEHTKWLANATGSAAPTVTDSSMRYYYQFSSTTPGSTMQSYHIVDAAEAKALAKDTDPANDATAYTYVKENQIYVMEAEVEGGNTYVWKAYEVDKQGNIVEGTDGKNKYLGTLKWYNDDSQFLKGFDGNSIDLSTMSAGTLLYTFIPSVFSNLATVVLNGSVKKILAEFFGAKFSYVGKAGLEPDEAVAVLGTDEIFVGEQGDYVFEWSDYAIIDGVHYYRFEDQLFVGDLSNTNNYFDIINWNYEITDDFMNQFIPADDTDVNTRLLNNFNDFLVKVAETITVKEVTTTNEADGKTADWVRPTFAAGNANIVANLKAAAQAVISLAPEHIFGSNYKTNEHCYYDMLVSTENETILAGIAATLVDALMPSMTLPTAEELMKANVKVGAILAAVVREFAAQLIPEFNYDALIYADFGTTTSDPVKTFLSGKDNNYWLDVILTMGVDIGFEYLRAFADMGEGSDPWNSFVAYSGYGVDGKTYAAGTSADALRNQWEGMLDYVIDWALFDGWVTETVIKETVIPGNTSDCDDTNDEDTIQREEVTETYLKYEWTWKMENLVNVSGLTIDLATKQDPWEKLQQVLGSILPVDEILTVATTAEYPTKMEKFLRYDLILGLLELRWADLINTVQFSGSHFRTDNVLDQLADLIKGIVNSLFAKVGGGSYELLPSVMTDIDSLANQSNLGVLVGGLLGALKVAGNDPDGSKGGLLDTVLPIVGMFLGWKADPQVMADPQVWTEFRNGNDYAYLYDNNLANQVQPGGKINGDGLNFTKIKILNNSAGMLETHRNSSVTDHAYDINIKNITSDAAKNTLTFTYDNVVSPWETVDIIIDGTYNEEEAVTVTIEYDYVGKDGKAVGGTQYTSVSFLLSNQYEDTNVLAEASKSGQVTRNAYNKYIFSEDIYTAITGAVANTSLSYQLFGTNNASVQQYQAPAQNGDGVDYAFPDYDQNAKGGYFTYNTQAESGFGTMEAGVTSGGASAGKFFKAANGNDENTEYPLGIYAFQKTLVTYANVQCTWDYVFIHYDDYGIYDLYTANKDNGYHANMGVDPAIYNEYNEAWKLIVYGATYPLMTELNGHASTDYLKQIMPYIPDAMDRFEAAKEAMDEALAEVQASGASAAALPNHVQSLYNYLATDDKALNGFEVNFQDYEYYEYFAYADLRTEARNVYASYLAPEVMDTYYILNSGIREAELDDVIEAEANATKAAAIAASRLENDPAAIAASIEARENWQMPIHSKLYIEDMEARLKYYKQFLTGHEESADHEKFLELEIAHVKAQNFKEADYEAASWERYADALATAEAVVAGTDEYASYNSRIFDAKWQLMVARKQLLKKADSLIEAGGTAKLIETIGLAEEILAMDLDDIKLSQVAIDKKLTKEQALGHLIQGLGYYYEGEDGNEWNLYADSAYEYRDNDRPNNSGNQAKVNAANANLEACIAYFVTEEAEPELILTPTGEDMLSIIDREIGTSSGEFMGLLYGVDTINGESLEDYFTTEAGSIEIIENENGVLSTGATVNLLDNDGNVVETYIFVYFGDVNGDEVVDITDAVAIELHDAWVETIEEDTATYYSAEVNYDATLDITDAVTIQLHDAWVEMLPEQAEIAAGINEAY